MSLNLKHRESETVKDSLVVSILDTISKQEMAILMAHCLDIFQNIVLSNPFEDESLANGNLIRPESNGVKKVISNFYKKNPT